MVRRALIAMSVALAAVAAGGCASAPAAPTGARVTGGTATAGTTGTAAGTTATDSAGSAASARARRFLANPAIQAAGEIVRVAPVVPFSTTQVHKLVPMLQALAKKPNQSASALAADAKAITAVFSTLQSEALKNMAKSHFTTGGAPRAFAGRTFHPPAGTTASSRRRPAGARHFNPAAIYQLAINVLEGKATGGTFFGRGGAPGAAGATAGGATAGGTGTVTTGTA